MPFTQELPEWSATGSKPPQSKLDTGWQIGERPPSGWWNWMLNRTYLSIQELQQEAINVDQKGVANGVASLNASGKVPSSQLDISAPSDASTTVKGIVMLEDSVASTSVTNAATPKSVKQAYDLAAGAIPVNQKGQANGVAPLNVNAKVAPSLIDQDASNRFVTDAEKLSYAAKASTAIATTSANGLMSAADKVKLDAAQLFKLTADDGTPKQTGVTNADLITESGEYYTAANCIGMPDAELYKITSQKINAGASIQYATKIVSNQLFSRIRSSSIWQPWRKLTDINLLGNAILGNKFVDQSNANFVGKVAGSTTANPHVIYEGGANSYPAPSAYTGTNEISQANYTKALSLDASLFTTSVSGVGLISKHVISFNVLEQALRTYGTIPGTTLAEKAAWAKVNISKITFPWFGFGSGPSGNKATIASYQNTAWVTGATHTNATVTKSTITLTGSALANAIDANGFVHFLAYADASDGTTASVINTDYVELQVELSTDIKSNLNIATTADKITIADTANYYAAAHVEGALAEIGQTLAGTRASIVTTARQLGVM